MTIDGFVARPDGALDWMWISGAPGAGGMQKVIEMADSSDTILLGRKMTKEFIDHWENVVDNLPESAEQPLAQRMVNLNKIAFSRTTKEINGRNLSVENGDLATVIGKLKNQPGKDLLVYGGANFVSSLISLDLIDEYHFVVNPVAIGSGLRIFMGDKLLRLESSVSFPGGKVWSIYLRG